MFKTYWNDHIKKKKKQMSTKSLVKQKLFLKLFLKESTEAAKRSWSGKLSQSFDATAWRALFNK